MTTIPLRRIARVVNGGTPTADQANWDGEIPWATPVDVGANHGGIVAATARTLTSFGAQTGSTIVPAGSLLVSTRAPIGYVSRAQVPMAFNQGCRALVPGPRADGRYLLYALLAARPELDARGQGTTFAELSADGLGDVPVCVPPLDEQRRIADFLDAETARLDRLLDLRRRQEDALAAQYDATVTAAIVGGTGGRGSVRLKHAGARVTVGIVVTPAAWYVDKGGVSAVRGVDVSRGSIRTEGLVQISLEGDRTHSKSRLRTGDVLVVRTGKAGAACTVPESLVGANAIDVLIIRPGDRLLPRFVEHIINSEQTRRFVEEFSVGTIQSHFNVGTLGELPIPVIPLDEQALVVKKLDELATRQAGLADAIALQRAFLTERRQALITAAVTGQLDVTTARAALS